MSIKFDFDEKAFRAAIETMTEWEIGPDPSRTNPTGTSKKVIDPRSLVASKLVRAVDFVIASLRELTPISDGPGPHARDSYNVRMGADTSSKGSFDYASYTVAAFDLPPERGDIIEILEYGTVPHVIRPKNAKFLRFPINPEDLAENVPGDGSGRVTFRTEEGGKTYINTTEVMHPGTRPHAMFRITAERVKPVAQSIANEVVREVAESFRRSGK